MCGWEQWIVNNNVWTCYLYLLTISVKPLVVQHHHHPDQQITVGKVPFVGRYHPCRYLLGYSHLCVVVCCAMITFQVIYTQVSDSWINVHDLLHFLEITDNTVTFLWASEETGYRHLYLITSSLCAKAMNGCNDVVASGSSSTFDSSQRLKFHGTNTADNHAETMDAATLHPRIINKVHEIYTLIFSMT